MRKLDVRKSDPHPEKLTAACNVTLSLSFFLLARASLVSTWKIIPRVHVPRWYVRTSQTASAERWVLPMYIPILQRPQIIWPLIFVVFVQLKNWMIDSPDGPEDPWSVGFYLFLLRHPHHQIFSCLKYSFSFSWKIGCKLAMQPIPAKIVMMCTPNGCLAFIMNESKPFSSDNQMS